MKKFISTVLGVFLLVSMTTTAIAANSENIFDDFHEIVQSEFYQESSPAIALDESSGKVIIHNNGAKMDSDFFADGDNQGNYLFAVTYIPYGESVIETAHFANVEILSDAAFINMITDYEANIPTNSVSIAASTDAEIKHYEWYFVDPVTDETLSTLTTAVTCERKSSNSTVDGVRCSVWDVTTFSQLEEVDAARLNDQYTRLSVDLANQHLIAYGPCESTSGGDLSVGLDGAGVPSISYSFNIDGFSVKDLSSMSNNYGRWAFIDNIGHEKHFTTKPGIRATNSHGNFVVELSHTVNMNTWRGAVIDQTTGVLQIYLNDR